jgi:type VI secretion system protein ImpB
MRKGSIPAKERINIRYVPVTLGQQAEVELPLRLVVVGDFTGKPDATSIEERKLLSVDKNTFSTVMEEAGLEQNFITENVMTGEGETDLKVALKFKSLQDFEPDSIVNQVPELKKMMELREALVALKGPLGNMPAFRRRLQQLLGDEASRQKLLKELDSATDAAPEQAPKGKAANGVNGKAVKSADAE